MRILLLLCCITIAHAVHAQCLSGNCVNGSGKYDYGWCVYEGAFKDSKAEGQGSMKYSDYTYKGSFKNGVEDGNGIITYPDGRSENVVYHNGRKAEGPKKLAAGEYKPLEPVDPGCTSGDCVNGFGTYEFESGNKYTGNFKNRAREGQGIAYFANGDKFDGIWSNNQQQNGTYSFASGAVYRGSYNENGIEYNGKLTVNGIEVPFINGVANVPKAPPKVTYVYEKSSRKSGPEGQQDHTNYKPFCTRCHGLGQEHEVYWGGATAVDKYGNRSTVFGGYNKCSACNGTGHQN